METNWARLKGLVVLLAIAAVGNGCTFYFLKGNGPRSYAEVAEELPQVSADQIEQWKADSHRPYLFFGRLSQKGRGLFKGYTMHSHPTPYWPLLAGPYRCTTFFEPDAAAKKTKRAMIKRQDDWGFLSLFYQGNAFYYDCETGRCLSAGRFTLITAFVIRQAITAPTGGGIYAVTKEPLEGTREPDAFRYDRMTSWSLGWGVLAAGTKNGRRYGQIAWIPIPLGSIE